jgi:hypothetical protein
VLDRRRSQVGQGFRIVERELGGERGEREVVKVGSRAVLAPRRAGVPVESVVHFAQVGCRWIEELAHAL